MLNLMRKLQVRTHTSLQNGEATQWSEKVEEVEELLAHYALELEMSNNYIPLPLPEYLTNKELDLIIKLLK